MRRSSRCLRPVSVRWVAAVMVVALSSVVGVSPAAAVEPSSALPSAAWSGTLRVVSSAAFQIHGTSDWKHSATGSYTNLVPLDTGSFLETSYQAHVNMNFSESWTYPCPDGIGRSLSTSTMSYSGPSTAKVDTSDDEDIQFGVDGTAFEMRDTDEGTFFRPSFAFFAAHSTGSGCGWPPSTGRMGSDALSYQHGHGSHYPDTPLVDNDPNPDHLVGTTTYGLSTIPGGPVWDYSAYSYSITYDLRRVAGALPVANPDPGPGKIYQKQTGLGRVLEFDVLPNDVGDGLSIYAVGGPAGLGTVSAPNGKIRWKLPASGRKPLLGDFTLSYSVKDNRGRVSKHNAQVSVRLYDCMRPYFGATVEVRSRFIFGFGGPWTLGSGPKVCFDGTSVILPKKEPLAVVRKVPPDVVPNTWTSAWSRPEKTYPVKGDPVPGPMQFAVRSEAQDCSGDVLDLPGTSWRAFAKSLVKKYGLDLFKYYDRSVIRKAFEDLDDAAPALCLTFFKANLNTYYSADGSFAVTVQTRVKSPKRLSRVVPPTAFVYMGTATSGAGAGRSYEEDMPATGAGSVGFSCNVYTRCTVVRL